MNIFLRLLPGLLLVALPCGLPVLPAPPADPVRVLLVTGGHEHDVEFYRLFQDPTWRVTVDPHPAAFTRDLRQRFDVVVLYDMVRTLDEPRQRHLRDFVESGRGVVALHHAICANVDWPWWVEEVLGGRYLFEPVNGRQSSYLHDRPQRITPVLDHPVTKGIGPFQIVDETYKNLWISPRARVLLRSDDPTSDGPVAWLGPHPRARVVYLQLGHDRLAHLNPAYRQLVGQSVRWAARRDQ
jgi:type 1 glutamine amidotransferase